MEITFLGTACMQPTKERNHSAILLNHEAEGILLDCGEGTQRQIKICGYKPTRVTKILISHWHGDHVLGIPGLLQTIASCDSEKTINIYGPKGSKKYISYMFKGFAEIDKEKFKVHEITKKKFFECEDYYLEAMELDHGILCLGFRFTEKDRRKIDINYVKKLEIPEGPLLGELQEGKNIKWKGETVKAEEATFTIKGRKLCYIPDTTPCANATKLAKDCDILISESSYTSEHKEKAEEYKHMTAEDAAQLASNANAKQLILTHFSQRYKELIEMENEAKKIFPETKLAFDCMKVKL